MEITSYIFPFKNVPFELSNLPNLQSKLTPPQVFPWYAPEIFEIAFCDSVKKSNRCMVCSEK